MLMLRDHPSFFLPNLLTFTNGNTYLGSFLGLRFRVKPEEDTLNCLTWYGEYCLEESEIVNQASFPLTDEGREQVIDWLEEEFDAMRAQQSGTESN